MTKKAEREEARRMVLVELTGEAKRRRENVAKMRGAVCDAYRREIARLWGVALRAVQAACVD